MSIRVGSVRFLNTRPLIDGLERVAGVTLVPAVPSMLLGMLERGEVDLALVSLIDAARSARPLGVLPAGMIGSDGPTLTVRLFSPVPIDGLEEVWADTDSHTSVALCRLLLARLGVRAHFRAFDARERMPLGPSVAPTGARFGVLLIGDKVVADPPSPDEYPHVLDLGEAWKEWTGLPFVYAAWMCDADRADDPEIALVVGLMDRQRRHNMTRLGSIAARHGAGAGWPLDVAEAYLTRHLRFDLGPREREAAQRFLDECASAGLAGATTIRWADWRGAARAAGGLAS